MVKYSLNMIEQNYGTQSLILYFTLSVIHLKYGNISQKSLFK